MLIFDDEPKCDLTTWSFDLSIEGLLCPDVIKDVLQEISDVIDQEVRKGTDAFLWDEAKEGEPLNPRICVFCPLGSTDVEAMDGKMPLFDLVEDCIDVEKPDADRLKAWGDYFTLCAAKFYDAAKASTDVL